MVGTADQMLGPVKRRLGEAYGVSVTRLLAQLQSPEHIEDLRRALGPALPGNDVPEWLEELAVTLLTDTGAQTRGGLRTGRIRLSPERLTQGYKAIDVETSEWGFLVPVDVVEQVRLSMAFAGDAWQAMNSLTNAGKEAEWALEDAVDKQGSFSTEERAKLEAAQRIGRELSRLRRVFADTSSAPPTALEQTVLTTNALASVQPAIRATAGWPAGSGLPKPRNPRDVAKMVSIGEALHAAVRTIANRMIAVWVANGQVDGEAQAR